MSPWNFIDDAIARLAEEQIRFRRQMHRNPESSGQEFETTKVIVETLRSAGLEPRLLRDGLGAIVDVDLGRPEATAKRVAIRADLDALPIQDEKTADYRSCVPGIMHACGHDGHAAIVLGAALACAAARNQWKETEAAPLKLRFLFQPAEEDARGAQWLIEQGALDGVSAALGVHLEPIYPVGHAGVRYGVLTASCDEVHIAIAGHGGHAARPHQTRDPILAAAQLVSGLYAILPRRIDARSPAVLSIAHIHAGITHNAIPERAQLSGTLRTIDPETREIMLERVVEVCSGIATMTGTTITPEFQHALPSVVNDARMAFALEEASKEVLGSEHVSRIEQPSLGGEDFSFYLKHVPGAMLRLGCTPPGASPQFLHTSRFDIDERALPLGSRILLRAAAAVSESIDSHFG